MSNIFLAGSTGIVGANILSLNTHHKIRACYHKTKPYIIGPDVRYRLQDLTEDSSGIMDGCDTAIIAAAYSGGAQFLREHPWEHMKINTIMNLQILDTIRKTKSINKVIFISTATVYPDFDGRKDESIDYNQKPHEAYYAYACGIRYIEQMYEFLHKKNDIDVVILRASSIYGPYDRFKPEVSHVIPALIKKAADKQDPFEVWGDPYVVRDIIFSEDVAKIIFKFIEQNIRFGIFNIGGCGIIIKEIVDLILKHSHHQPRIKYLQSAPTTIKKRLLDNTNLLKEIGNFKFHSADEGIYKTIQWWIEHKDKWRN